MRAKATLIGGSVGLAAMAAPLLSQACTITGRIIGPPSAVCSQHKALMNRADTVALFEVVAVEAAADARDPEIKSGTATVKVLKTFRGGLEVETTTYPVFEDLTGTSCPAVLPNVGDTFVGYVNRSGRQGIDVLFEQVPAQFQFEEDACAATG
jgi:hypothetical protein